MALDADNVAIDEVFDAARRVMDDTDRRLERDLLDRLAEGIGTGNGGVAGPEDVFKALIERRVGTLLLERTEGWGEAIELAFAQAADVRIVRHFDDLRRHEGIAALLRF